MEQHFRQFSTTSGVVYLLLCVLLALFSACNHGKQMETYHLRLPYNEVRLGYHIYPFFISGSKNNILSFKVNEQYSSVICDTSGKEFYFQTGQDYVPLLFISDTLFAKKNKSQNLARLFLNDTNFQSGADDVNLYERFHSNIYSLITFNDVYKVEKRNNTIKISTDTAIVYMKDTIDFGLCDYAGIYKNKILLQTPDNFYIINADTKEIDNQISFSGYSFLSGEQFAFIIHHLSDSFCIAQAQFNNIIFCINLATNEIIWHSELPDEIVTYGVTPLSIPILKNGIEDKVIWCNKNSILFFDIASGESNTSKINTFEIFNYFIQKEHLYILDTKANIHSIDCKYLFLNE